MLIVNLLSYGVLLLPLLFLHGLELGVPVPKFPNLPASPGLGFLSSFPPLEISKRWPRLFSLAWGSFLELLGAA